MTCPRSTSGASSDIAPRTAELIEAAAKRLASVPYWAQPLPLPPEHDFLADVEADRKLAAVMCAVARIAKQRGKTFTQQVEIWTKEEGE